MTPLFPIARYALLVTGSLACALALAALPPPTPAQQQAQAGSAQQAALQAEKAKQALAASMEQVTTRWRARAVQNGWAVNAATAPATPKDASVPAAADTGAVKAAVRSEKKGTAPASTDVKDPSKKGL
ncbi:MAG: hypothetical protein NVSMB6_10280 [Burkholderiaceae bacterium]